MPTTSRARGVTRRRTGNNEGGILGLIDGNRPAARRKQVPTTLPRAKEQFIQSSASSSSSDNDDSSIQHTPPPKTLMFSKLAGSPMEDDSCDEADVSDLSCTPTSTKTSENNSGNQEEEETPEYSLKPRPLFVDKEADAYGADNESVQNDSDESNCTEESVDDDDSISSSSESNSHPTPDTLGAISSLGGDSMDEEDVSVESDVESEESVEDDEEENALESNDEESDDEYVIEDSSSDTEDDDLDSDIELETPIKQKRGRSRKQTTKQAAASSEKENVPEKTAKPKAVDARREEKVKETINESNELEPSPASTKKSVRASPRKQPAKEEDAQASGVPAVNANTEKESVSKSPAKKTNKTKQQKSIRARKQAKAAAAASKKNERVHDKAKARDKKETIYELNRDQQLSAQDEMVVVAEILKGTFLDDDDDTVVIAEVISDGNEETDEELSTVALGDDDDDPSLQESNGDIDDGQGFTHTSFEESKEAESSRDEEYEEDDANDAPFIDDDENEGIVCTEPSEDTEIQSPSSPKPVANVEPNKEMMEEDSEEPSVRDESVGVDTNTGSTMREDCLQQLPDNHESIQPVIPSVQCDQLAVGETDDTVQSPCTSGEISPAPSESPTAAPKDELIVPAPNGDDEAASIDIPALADANTDRPTLTKPSTPKEDEINADPAEVLGGEEGALEESVISVQSSSDGEAEEKEEPSRRPRLRRFRSEGSIKPGKWGTGSKIGVGSFGVVRVGMNKKTGTLMAVKSIEVSRAVMKDIQTEINLLKSLDHINIVRYLGAETDGTHLHIFQEWVPGGSVTSLLHKFGPFSMPVVRAYLFQILSGLAYLHDNGILHRDIKGGNVLVSDAGVVKLADFGSSKRLVLQHQDAMETMTMRGTPYYMAPEVFEEKYGTKADIWSVGCVAFQMATGSPPWKAMGYTNPMTLFLFIKESEGLPSHEWPTTNQEDTTRFKALLEKCFFRDPSKRPTAKELSSDAFFTVTEQSSSEDTQSRGLFSPGNESLSTWGSARSSKRTPTRSSSPQSQLSTTAVGKANASFLSPPLPTRIHQGSSRHEVISPLAPSPVVDASDWPKWARERLVDRKSPYKTRPETEGGEHGLPPASPSRRASPSRMMMDSLAISEDSSTVVNPFRRRNRKSGDSSLGTGSVSTLFGLHFLEGKSDDSNTPGKLSFDEKEGHAANSR